MGAFQPTSRGPIIKAMKEALNGPPGTARRVSKIFREKWEELRGMYLDILTYLDIS